jgi:hypothetical protein
MRFLLEGIKQLAADLRLDMRSELGQPTQHKKRKLITVNFIEWRKR